MKARFTWYFTALATLLIGAALSSAHATTAPDLIWCQGCSGLQKHNAVMSRPVGATVYVADAINGTYAAYHISGTPSTPHDPNSPYTPSLSKFADPITPDPELAVVLESAIGYYQTAPVGFHKHVIVPVDGQLFGDSSYPPSVYDIINDGPNQYFFTNKLNSTSGEPVLLAFAHLIQGLANFHAVNTSAGPTLSTKLTFSDGSTIEAKYDQSSGKLKLDLSTARDSHGNRIPYLGVDGKKHNLGGIHDFDPSTGNPNDLNNFLNQLSMMGVPINYGTGGGATGGGGYHGWACIKETSSDGKVVYTCQQF